MSPAACGLALLALDRAPPLVRPDPVDPDAAQVAAPPPAGEKDVRDAFGSFPNQRESANFVLKWGDDGSVRDAQAESALDAFELAWQVEIASMGHPAPGGTAAYKFNVYVGDSGNGAPPSYGAAGYYYRDDDGYPYIVLAPDTLGSAYLASTTAHEFYHSLQDATGSYAYSGVSAWYWEATAMWMEGEVYPDDADYYSFLFGYALLPALPVWYFDYPDTGALGEYHQYGAMIWPRYLTEHVADWTIVRDSWVSPGAAATPQKALANGLADRGEDVGAVFAAFAAHDALWDYADGDGMAAHVEGYERYFRDDARPIADTVAGTTDGMVDAPRDTLPEAWGFALVDWNHDDGAFAVEVSGDATGSEGSTASWGVTIAWWGEDGAVYTPIPLALDEGAWSGAATVELGRNVEEAYLVAALLADDVGGQNLPEGETWAWSYGVAEVDPPDDTADTGDAGNPEGKGGDDRACGCTSGGSPTWGPMLAAVLGLWRARRGREAR